MSDQVDAKLTMGPVLFNWKPEAWRDFYFRIADESPVDSVCIGEVVCSKREPFLSPFIPEIIERLKSAGKEVVLSTLALVMSKRDRDIIRDVVGMDGVLIEANDVSALPFLKDTPHTVGPMINVYNEGALDFMHRNGAVRVTLPVELSLKSLSALQAFLTSGPELEVFAYGRLPLAISARCYHARAHGLSKDGCRYVCAHDADGMDIDTIDDQPFLVVNGVQTMSRTCASFLASLPELMDAGVHRFRLSPQSWDMIAVSRIFRDALDGGADLERCEEKLECLNRDMGYSNGYLYGGEGINYYTGALAAS